MNLLEHYVTNITYEEPIEKNGMLIVMATKRFRQNFCLQKMIMQKLKVRAII